MSYSITFRTGANQHVSNYYVTEYSTGKVYTITRTSGSSDNFTINGLNGTVNISCDIDPGYSFLYFRCSKGGSTYDFGTPGVPSAEYSAGQSLTYFRAETQSVQTYYTIEFRSNVSEHVASYTYIDEVGTQGTIQNGSGNVTTPYLTGTTQISCSIDTGHELSQYIFQQSGVTKKISASQTDSGTYKYSGGQNLYYFRAETTPTKYKANISFPTDGSVSAIEYNNPKPDGSGKKGEVNRGATIKDLYDKTTFKATPEYGYRIIGWIVNTVYYSGAEYTYDGGATCNIAPVTARITFTATFTILNKSNIKSISYFNTGLGTSGQYGTITNSGESVSGLYGNVTFTAVANTGYEITSWYINNYKKDAASDGSYTYYDNANVDVRAVATKKHYSATIEFPEGCHISSISYSNTGTGTSGQRGTVTSKTTITGLVGQTVFAATAEEGYAVSSWIVGGSSAGSGDTYTYNNNADLVISATGTAIKYVAHILPEDGEYIASISYENPGTGWTGTYSTNNTVSNLKASTKFTCKPKTGCKFQSWKYRVGSQDADEQTSTDAEFTYAGGKAIYIRAIAKPQTAVKIWTGSKWQTAIPYVYTGGKWSIAIAYVYDNGKWKQAN